MIKHNIEDCLEQLVSLQNSDCKFELKSEDVSILQSIGRQVVRGTGLTDRQLELVKTKLLFYKSMFNYDVTKCFNNLRIPIRNLNREKTIQIVTKDNVTDNPLIAVKFIFNKKYLNNIELLKRESTGHLYDNKEKIHYFPFTENNLFHVINRFKNCNFSIPEELMSYYEKVKEMNNNKNNHIPGIYSFKLKNLSDKAIDFMISSIGEPSKENLALYNDRKDQLGLHHFDHDSLQESLNSLTILSRNIVNRTQSNVLIKPQKYPIERVLESLLELNRFPLLVILPLEKNNLMHSPLDGLIPIDKGLSNIIFKDDISVLFRTDNKVDKNFNEYIKDNKLNNSLDNNTKVVYINSNKFPKPLLKSNWKPSSVLCMGSYRLNPKISDYIYGLDLVIHYDTDLSPFNKVKVQEV
tara:strand:- start:160 stop:1386 length:1227 start_codon:yes stop_codon:yes gene_type:complete